MIRGNLSDLLILASSGEKPDPIRFDVDLAIFTFVIFIGLLIVLTKYAWKPLMDGLTQRETSIADKIAAAARATKKRRPIFGNTSRSWKASTMKRPRFWQKPEKTVLRPKKKSSPKRKPRHIDNAKRPCLISRRPETMRFANWRKKVLIRPFRWPAISWQVAR